LEHGRAAINFNFFVKIGTRDVSDPVKN